MSYMTDMAKYVSHKIYQLEQAVKAMRMNGYEYDAYELENALTEIKAWAEDRAKDRRDDTNATDSL